MTFPVLLFMGLLGAVVAPQLGYQLVLASAWQALVFLLVAPVLEEYVFRAHLQQTLAERWGRPWRALGVASGVFALAHAPWLGWPALGLLLPGVLLGVCWLRHQSLWRNVLLHSSLNGALAGVTAIL